MKSYSESYKNAGVDVTAGYKSVELMKRHVKKTFNSSVLQDIGGFGGLFIPDLGGMAEPVLVSGTDGVGTKLKLAFLLGKHDTVGIDCVAMCVNDVLCCGAKPLFFLDYIALGKLVPEKVADIVKGVADGCLQAGSALIGGETAEMPGFYPEDEYDLAGFSVGIVDKSKIIDGSKVKKGDAVIGIASSGVHSNGFSLVRKVFGLNSEKAYENLIKNYDELGCTLGEALLCPTKIYVKAINALRNEVEVKAVSHITGGGFYENMPRMLPDGVSIEIDSRYEKPPVFSMIQSAGDIPEHDMYNTFNMGVGMAVVVEAEDADRAVAAVNAAGERAFVLGKITEGDKEIIVK